MIQNYFFRSKIVILSAAIIISILDRIMSKWLTLLTHRLIQRNLGQVRKFPGIPGIHKTKQNRKRNAPKAKSKNIHRIHDTKSSFRSHCLIDTFRSVPYYCRRTIQGFARTSDNRRTDNLLQQWFTQKTNGLGLIGYWSKWKFANNTDWRFTQ